MPVVAAAIGFILILGLFAFGASELGYRLFARYAPLNEQVRRETYEQSRAFREGTVRDLENLQLEWAGATPEKKAALRPVVLHRLAALPDDLLTPNLRGFASDVRGVQ